ncbi:hypothetical protein MVEN_01698200 [Mycena venus]|uniref:Uncharacterized protein n=1 Tax=Mycena venus TaxID=2733690 RepID=A0A8H6XLX9_9AGAR|nr:hypothetical protein MVEN_01698200 [Mycena venus]
MATQLECPAVDKAGNKLTGNGEDAGVVSCVYSSGPPGPCFYDANGELDAEASGDPLCPSQLVSPASVSNRSKSSTPTSGASSSSALTTSKGGTTQSQGAISSSSPPISSPLASISSQGGSISTSSATTGKSPAVSSPPVSSQVVLPFPMIPPSATNPAVSPTLSTAKSSNRNEARTAAIAGSLTAVFVLVAIVVVIFWIRRHRKLEEQTRLPEQFVEAQERVLRDNLRPKAGIPRPASNVSRADPIDIEPENTEGVEPITVRMRRVEAQLQAILTMGFTEGSPPSYIG